MTIFDDHQNDAYPSNCAVKMTISSNHGQAGFRSQESALNDTIIYPCDHETCHTRFVCLNANEE
jgi:hypothetical protein